MVEATRSEQMAKKQFFFLLAVKVDVVKKLNNCNMHADMGLSFFLQCLGQT
jgi:hypothetical protein